MAAVLLVGAASLSPSAVAGGATEGGLVIDTTVDADGDGMFADLEEAPSASAPVSFRVVLTNTLDLDLTVSSLSNAVGATTQDLLAAGVCPDMAGTLVPNMPRTCTFTVDRYLHTYANQPRDELTNLVTATATAGDDGMLVASDGATVVNPNAGRVSAAVDLSNDADGDGRFTDHERAIRAGTDVTFRVAVQNTSPGAVVVADLWVTWPGAESPTDLFAHCPELEQMRLWGIGGAGHDGGHDDGGHDDGHGEKPTTATCTYTMVAHAPLAGTARTDTVTVTLAKRHSPDRRASASDGTTVRTAAPAPAPSPPATDPPSEAPTDPSTEVPTDPSTEVPTDPPTDPPTEVPTDPSTEVPTAPPTEAPTEAPTVVDSTAASASEAPAVGGVTADRDAVADRAVHDELAVTGLAMGLLLAALASLLLGALAVWGGRPDPAPADRPGPAGPTGPVSSDRRAAHSTP